MKIRDLGVHRDFEANSEDFGGVSSAFRGGASDFGVNSEGFGDPPTFLECTLKILRGAQHCWAEFGASSQHFWGEFGGFWGFATF